MGFYMFLFLNYLRDLRDITLCGFFKAQKGMNKMPIPL